MFVLFKKINYILIYLKDRVITIFSMLKSDKTLVFKRTFLYHGMWITVWLICYSRWNFKYLLQRFSDKIIWDKYSSKWKRQEFGEWRKWEGMKSCSRKNMREGEETGVRILNAKEKMLQKERKAEWNYNEKKKKW